MREFDKFAADYRSVHTKSIQNLTEFDSEYFAQYKIDIIKNELKTAPQTILDFGCGDGLGCELLSRAFPGAQITGIDVSAQCINEAKARNLANCEFLYGNIDILDTSFDLIFSAGVFHHIDRTSRKSILSQLIKLCKKDIYIFEHNPFNPVTQKVVKECVFDEDADLVLPGDFVKMAKPYKPQINYTLFVPRYKILRPFFALEKFLKKLPLGAQYYVRVPI